MTTTKIATYLPPWAAAKGQRLAGVDEDCVTMAVSAAIPLLNGVTPSSIVLVSRQPALLEGGSAAVICAGLGLNNNTEVIERLGGAASAMDALTSAAPNTLVIGVDCENGAGAAAALIGDDRAITINSRIQRSLPVRTRHLDGSIYLDDDARLERERGIRAAFDGLNLDSKPLSIAGLSAKVARPFCAPGSPLIATTGASSPFFALAALSDNGTLGLCAGFDQACLSVANLNSSIDVLRSEPEAQQPPKLRQNPGADIKIALTAYDRAFEPKLRWESGCCNECGTLAMPPRYRCISCGAEDNSTLKPLPRNAEVYTLSTIHIPVPGLKTPYSLVIAQLEGVDVRVLVTVTDVEAGKLAIGDKGTMVFRRISMRSGVPDYGYAFSPQAKIEDKS